MIEPSAAAKVIETARFLLAMIAGVMNTSGGINKNMDSHTVIKNTTQAYQGFADLSKILFINFTDVIIKYFELMFNCLNNLLVFFIYQCIIAAKRVL